MLCQGRQWRNDAGSGPPHAEDDCGASASDKPALMPGPRSRAHGRRPHRKLAGVSILAHGLTATSLTRRVAAPGAMES